MKNYIEQALEETDKRITFLRVGGYEISKAVETIIRNEVKISLTDLLNKVQEECVPKEYHPEEYISPTRLLDINTGYKICRETIINNLDNLRK